MRFYSLRTWLRYIFALRFTKQLLFHWWGMVIIRNWRKDERNKAFIKALKRMWPRPTARHGARRRPRERRRDAGADDAAHGRRSHRRWLSGRGGQDGRVSS